MEHHISRVTALEKPLTALNGWHLSIACQPCRLVVQLRCGELARIYHHITVGETVRRLRCSRCGSRPSSVALSDAAVGAGRAGVRVIELLEVGPPSSSTAES